MAQKLLNGALLIRRFGISRCLPIGPIRLLITRSPAHALCINCQCSAAGGCIGRQGCQHLQVDGISRSLGTTSTLARETFANLSVGLHRDSGRNFILTQVHGATVAEEDAFQQHLKSCSSSQQVFTLVRSVRRMSGVMAASALHRVADLEQVGNCLKDPAVLEEETIRALCFQLEKESRQLEDTGLVSALFACTRLFLDPWSTLMVRLVSESQERLDKRVLTVEQLCILGLAIMAMEGPNCMMLEQVMGQIQQQEPAEWSLAELVAVYRFLQSGLVRNGKYQNLLNAMHIRALRVSSRMNPAAVSGVLNTLVTLNQIQAMPLVISLCKQAVRHVPHFTDEELTGVLGALMHFGHSDQFFVDAMEKYVPTMTFTSHPETVTKVIQFFGRRNILSPVVLDSITESFVYRADDYSTSQVARHIVALGKLGYLPPNAGAVFRKVENFLHLHFSHFQPQTLLNLLHSCTLMERFPVNFVSKVFGRYFLQQLQEHGSGADHYVLAQLTQLHMTVELECPFYEGNRLPQKYQVKSFLVPGRSLETPVDPHLYSLVKDGLINLFGSRLYFGSKVLTSNCYTLDVEIKLDEERFVLPATHVDEVYKRIALCIDGPKRFTVNKRQLLGIEAIKQRHLRLLGYEVIQIPFYEFEKLENKASVVEYLHQKIFPHSYRLSW